MKYRTPPVRRSFLSTTTVTESAYYSSMGPPENHNENGQDASGSGSEGEPKGNDSERSNSSDKQGDARTTSTGTLDESNLNNIPYRFQQLHVSLDRLQGTKRAYDGTPVNISGNFARYLSDYDSWQSFAAFGSNRGMRDQAANVFNPKYYGKARNKIKPCRLETRMRRMTLKKRKAYKMMLRCSSEAHAALKKNEKPKKRKPRPCVLVNSLERSSDDSSGEVSPY